jgi:hypothetical protein
MFVSDKLETISFNHKNKPKMKKLSTLDVIVRLAIVAIVIGVTVTYYMYSIGQFGNK